MTDQIKDTSVSFILWINRPDHILSFKKAERFEQIIFSSYSQMMDYAFQISQSGYRIH